MKKFLVVWWMSQTPHAALFDHEESAEAAAAVRNAIMVTVSSRSKKIDVDVADWYRRDDEGRPMPAEWRDLFGQSQAIPGPRRKP